MHDSKEHGQERERGCVGLGCCSGAIMLVQREHEKGTCKTWADGNVPLKSIKSKFKFFILKPPVTVEIKRERNIEQ